MKVIISLLLLFLLVSQSILAQRPEPKEIDVYGHTMYTLLKPGDIPAIFDPEFINISIADSFYYSDEPLIVVTDGSIVKGYSTWYLDHHEVVNDYINGKAITVTW